ncbi:glycosyl transferase family 2, partial [Micromonospora chalcea]
MAVAADTRPSRATTAGPPGGRPIAPVPPGTPADPDRRQRNVRARLAYARCGAVAGPLRPPRPG